jgi:hydroxyacylglutathione hydrolase
MKQIYPDLWQTRTEHPIADVPSLSTHAYLLTREQGNLLFYSTGLDDEHARIRELGGITHQLLSHEDEVGPALARLKELFGSKLAAHRREAEAVAKVTPVDLAFDAREVVLGGVEVIPTPGHTLGSVCYRVQSPHGRTYLFTGDTLFFDEDGALKEGLLPGSHAGDLRESLRLLRDVESDVVISSASVRNVTPFREVPPEEWRTIVDAAIARLT